MNNNDKTVYFAITGDNNTGDNNKQTTQHRRQLKTKQKHTMTTQTNKRHTMTTTQMITTTNKQQNSDKN